MFVYAFKHSINQLNRGRYLVEKVGLCADCHTPVDIHGKPIMSKWLEGATLGFKPIHPIPGWAAKSTAIAGLPEGWRLVDMIKFLTTGKDPEGKFARPPMPAYRLSQNDARAVSIYLKSLKGKR